MHLSTHSTWFLSAFSYVPHRLPIYSGKCWMAAACSPLIVEELWRQMRSISPELAIDGVAGLRSGE